MTSLVTGGAGFIACTLISRLLDAGGRVIAVDNLSRGTRENMRPFADHPRFAFVHADLVDLDRFRGEVVRAAGSEPVSEVWHLAANSDIPAGVADPGVDLRDTFMTTFNVLRVMRDLRIPALMFASSSAIYGDLGDRALTEDVGPLFPISNYGAMKLASEAQITAACEAFLSRGLIFRFPNVVGVPATHGVILDFVRKLASDGSALPVLGDGTQRKSYLHVTDLVDAMLFVKQRAERRVDAFNIGPVDEGVTVSQIAREVVSVVSPGARIVFGEGAKGWVGDVPRFRYSVEKLSGLGWRPSLGSLDAIRRAVREIAEQERV